MGKQNNELVSFARAFILLIILAILAFLISCEKNREWDWQSTQTVSYALPGAKCTRTIVIIDALKDMTFDEMLEYRRKYTFKGQVTIWGIAVDIESKTYCLQAFCPEY